MLLYVPRTFTDGIGNVVKGWLTALGVDPTATVEPHPTFGLARYQSVLDPRHLYTGDRRVPIYTCRLRVLRTEEQAPLPTAEDSQYAWGRPELDTLYSDSLIDWHYDRAALSDQVVNRIHGSLDTIRLLPAITTRVQWLVGQLRGRVLGVGVRTWKAAHEQGVQRAYSEQTYLEAIRRELDNVETVVLCADRPDTLEAYEAYISHWPVRVVVPARVSTDDATQAAFVQMIALAHADVLIGTRLSTFTELAWWWGRNHARVVPLF